MRICAELRVLHNLYLKHTPRHLRKHGLAAQLPVPTALKGVINHRAAGSRSQPGSLCGQLLSLGASVMP